MSDAYPEVHEWTIPARPRPGVTPRVYEQRELSMDGEMRLFSLLGRTVERLRSDGFDFGALVRLFPDIDADDPQGSVQRARGMDFGALGLLLAKAAEAAPFLLSEGAATLLGIFPTDHLGARNPDYPDEVAFLRRNLHVSDVVQMLEVAWSQNDVERLMAPFVRVAKEVMYQYGAATAKAAGRLDGGSTSS